ncbi:Glycoside hydrolase, superfamily [Phaffia rhodozyma]|uniref:Glycoside hydrolase, superfamily n=1 Tax=Phaffia rhodozyma TaxID=264483 RepID=A0A0F7SF28_PHARH|nr:Glycoside hydrolase, superfamily [Phaffia rhodozyma]
MIELCLIQSSDEYDRTVVLRGVNLCAKNPLGHPSHDSSYHLGLPSSPDTAGQISFVGSPFKLEDAEVHIARLTAWGFRAVRLAICWEAIEHEGPGKYDEEYIDYVVALLHKLKEGGFRVFIDPHQDCWSRASGGSGAPYWTLVACGLDPNRFQSTQATLAHGLWNGSDGRTKDEKWPDMIWQTNTFKLACLTLFTLFFAGRTFAPKCIIDGINIQDWLHEKYLNAFGRLADRIAEDGELNDVCVIGWDSINEPQEGFIGNSDLSVLREEQSFRTGPTPTAFEALKLGMGQKQKIQKYKFGSTGSKSDGYVTVDPEGQTCWLAPEEEPGGISKWGWKRDAGWTTGTCIWAVHGVWDIEQATLLQPDYFSKPVIKGSEEVDFLSDYWVPHWKLWNARIRKSHPQAIAFINPPVFGHPPTLDEADENGRVCLSPHFYDGMTLINKRLHSFNADAVGLARKTTSVLGGAYLGLENIKESMRHQFGQLTIKDTSSKNPDNGLSTDKLRSYPAVLGEIGVPFDFKKTDKLFGLIARGGSQHNYREQEKAMDTSLTGCDGKNAVGSFVWAYDCHNTKEKGDGWNGEDLSIFCKDDYRTKIPSMEVPRYMYDLLNIGARAQRAFSRPYPIALVGRLRHLDFSMDKSELTMEVEEETLPNPSTSTNRSSPVWTEVYLPYIHFTPFKLDAGADEIASLSLQPELSQQSIVFNPSSILASSASTPFSAHLISAPEKDPPLGLEIWSAETGARPRIDIKVHVHLQEGLPAQSGGGLIFEMVAVGQILKWRWVTADKAKEVDGEQTNRGVEVNSKPVKEVVPKEGKLRKYSIKIEKWLGHGLSGGLAQKISQILP